MERPLMSRCRERLISFCELLVIGSQLFGFSTWRSTDNEPLTTDSFIFRR